MEELSEVQGRPWDDVDVSKSVLNRPFLLTGNTDDRDSTDLRSIAKDF